VTALPPHIAWANGGEARIVSASASLVSLVSSVPWPPGSRVSGTLLDPPHAAVRIKVHASRAEPDGTFRIEGRPLDLSREMRERLERLIPERNAVSH
jgi:hypothetical protein